MPQHLIFTLDGITAGDYLAWVRDPEPAALGNALRSIAVHADALGDLIEVDLVWEGVMWFKDVANPTCTVDLSVE